LLILPFVIAGGRFWPWTPQTIDLSVYYHAVRAMLDGANIMEFTSPGWNLYFIYPPVAAILMLPLAIGPYLFWQLVWIGLLILAQNTVLARCGLPRGWVIALVSIALVIGMEPIRTTIGYGQINTMLMALVIIDLLPGEPGRRRRLPQGLLIGIAAAVKLTPALFVLLLLILGKKRPAITAMITFAVLTAIGTLFQFEATVAYLKSLAGGDTHTSGPVYVGNQSLLGVVLRIFGETGTNTILGLIISLIAAVLAAIVGAYWWKRGAQVLAIGLVGLGTNLASPLSWTHHFVWMLPLGIAVVHQIARRPWAMESGPIREVPLHARLPRWMTISVAMLVCWVSVCLPLALLPYGAGDEANYSVLQQVVANLGPVLGLALLVGSTAWMISQNRSGSDLAVTPR
jgi:alpha-1,2-mannosyltransferase